MSIRPLKRWKVTAQGAQVAEGRLVVEGSAKSAARTAVAAMAVELEAMVDMRKEGEGEGAAVGRG